MTKAGYCSKLDFFNYLLKRHLLYKFEIDNNQTRIKYRIMNYLNKNVNLKVPKKNKF